MVNEDFALAHTCKGTVRPQCHLTQIIVVSDTGHYKILALGCSFRSRRGLATVLLDPLLGLGRGPVIYGHFMAALVLQMPRHRVAHDTKAQKRHFRHRQSPLKIPALPWPAVANAYLPIGHCQGGRVNGLNDPVGLTRLQACLWCALSKWTCG